MEFNLFIVPLTLIITQLIKSTPIKNTWMPHISVVLGGVLGAVYALYYGGDLMTNIVTGVIYGASASGIYDAAKNTKEVL